jgi:hypothetical protein
MLDVLLLVLRVRRAYSVSSISRRAAGVAVSDAVGVRRLEHRTRILIMPDPVNAAWLDWPMSP